jgi:LAO/AO transport system kinase
MHDQLLERILAGDRRALARAITLIENGDPAARNLLRDLHPHSGRAYVVGITGPPGAGKSTLVDHLARTWRERGRTVGIVAVDPSSPFTGGALLGDRVRMQSVGLDPGVFIRSLATRGHLGGVSRATADVVKAIDAFGKDVIMIETVGVGQAEVEVATLARTTVVVVVPGMGDDVQAIKAGILEIGDVFVINKADRDGVDRTVMEIEMMLDLGSREGGLAGRDGGLAGREGWRPPVVKTIAQTGEGVEAALDAAERHHRHLKDTGALAAKLLSQGERELRDLVAGFAAGRILARAEAGGDLSALTEAVVARRIDPYSAAEEILTRFGGAAHRAGEGPDPADGSARR